ncbi:hypothetical protein L1F30_02885 [Simiduia sp. 21SJ11W-1]|uniref:hypothetical protein n=1 Tax=Simiduia sp. 21SJ11W-1 TaxID=2909669 RepID=UPI00209D2FFC|nr:hypothetical protein [Simiduia sp. 21SJ11W-1]UTA48499.1 hypothetical protein L1F30_02885 [Simiduia sp. 21SJ11W-1]
MQEPSQAVQRRANAIAKTLCADEWHALVDLEQSKMPHWLAYRIVRYSEMLALRELGARPLGLAATLLLAERKPASAAGGALNLLWQRRSATSHLFPGFYSVLGGGFNPYLNDANPGDHNSPQTTAVRECFEESNLTVTIAPNTWVALTRETDSGAMQINYLGVETDFTGMQADETEGSLHIMPAPEQQEIAGLENFTDLAKGCLYAWRCVGG